MPWRCAAVLIMTAIQTYNHARDIYTDHVHWQAAQCSIVSVCVSGLHCWLTSGGLSRESLETGCGGRICSVDEAIRIHPAVLVRA